MKLVSVFVGCVLVGICLFEAFDAARSGATNMSVMFAVLALVVLALLAMTVMS